MTSSGMGRHRPSETCLLGALRHTEQPSGALGEPDILVDTCKLTWKNTQKMRQ